MRIFGKMFLGFMLLGAGQSQAFLPCPQTASAFPENRLVLAKKSDEVPEKYGTGFASISAPDGRAVLAYLASDELEGRETGTRGMKLAAAYASSLFTLWHVQPGGDGTGDGRLFSQQVVMRDFRDLGCSLELEIDKNGFVERRVFKEGLDFENYYLNRIPDLQTAPVVFAGYGISDEAGGYDDFDALDVKGKIVLILDGSPAGPEAAALFNKTEWREKYGAADNFIGRLNRSAGITQRGAAAVLVARQSVADGDMFVDDMAPVAADDSRPIIAEPSRLTVLPGDRRGNGSIHITRDMADAILSAAGQSVDALRKRIASSGHPASFEVPGARLSIETSAATDQLLRCQNIIGYCEGSDPELKKEVLLIGAHLDHLGKRGDYVFNGADDNGSGAAAVLQIARAVAANPSRPKRTIVFCLWTGEEFNRLGSRYYLAHPEFPLERTSAYCNLDMIGRRYSESAFGSAARRNRIPPEKQSLIRPDRFFRVGLSAGRGFEEILDRADRMLGIDLLLQPEKEARLSGIVSDYLSFFQARIPYLYWAGPTLDDYHQTSDSVDKVDWEWMAELTRLAYLTLMMLADQ